ncbi:TetR/AcrR family transcriptional regulator [Streptacidiphilus griseoplanus]|uniref:TetR/AcrR family transcriptional regulator n=1 Tax=Peterkaempfera griseoplana TaxID=66896 RepID=UPI0006E37A10|nr:TetR/AcrR family transcriptional regulator [Peterkaempfera griseoplana]
MPPAPDPSPDPRPRRVRDPELHRRAILEAAAQAFAERGYSRATLRDIARRAGVTHGLVLRHFGSKENLFLAAVPGTRDVDKLAEDSTEPLPTRIAREFVRRLEGPHSNDTFVTLVRSATDDEHAAAGLYAAMEERTNETYRRLLGGHALEHRVPFLAALLVGVTFSRYVIRAGALAGMSAERFTEDLAGSIDALLRVDARAPSPDPSAEQA